MRRSLLALCLALTIVPAVRAGDEPITARIARRVELGGPDLLPDHKVLSMRWSPDGTVVAVHVSPGELLLVDPRDGAIEQRWPADDALEFAFSPDGRRIVIGTSARIEVWTRGATRPEATTEHLRDARDLRVVLGVPMAGVTSIAASRDGRRLAVGLATGDITVLDVELGPRRE